jgi:hypothetical protein
MTATVKNKHGFIGAVTVAAVNKAECDSKKCLRKITVLSHVSVKRRKLGYCHLTGFQAESLPWKTPV